MMTKLITYILCAGLTVSILGGTLSPIENSPIPGCIEEIETRSTPGWDDQTL